MTPRREIDVRPQTRLPLRKVVELVRSGIRHRLLRSTLTMSVILLAVAFFMFSLSENALLLSIGDGVQAEISEQRGTPRLLSRIMNPKNSIQMADYLARNHDDEAVLEEVASVTGWQLREVEDLARRARQEVEYLSWFDDLSVGKRIALLGRAEQRAAFERLQESSHWEQFSEQVRLMSDVLVPNGLPALRTFVDAFPDYLGRLRHLVADWAAAIEALRQTTERLTGGEALTHWLATASDERFGRWREAVIAAGFRPRAERFERLRDDLVLSLRLQEIQSMLNTAEAQRRWMHTFKFRATTEEMLARLDDPRMVDVLEGAFDHQQLSELAANLSYERRLSGLEQQLAGVLERGTDAGLLSGRQLFLLIISFMVCMVGIANAMLMAITERFREIATMKCLGATDGFILEQFMMEASMQGLAGGLLGMVIGFLLTFGKLLLLYGSYPLFYFPGQTLLLCAGISLLSGILLSVFASIYPSYSASRMAPMEAMRVE
ncbi:MAG: ABC transporter permease [Planctomycetota bacterium]